MNDDAAHTRLAPVRPLLARLPECADLVELIRGALVETRPPCSATTPSSAPATRPIWTICARPWTASAPGSPTLEASERERTGIRRLKIGYNKVFGYYLEVTNAHAAQRAGGLHPQADAGQRRALHHARAEGARGRRSSTPRSGIVELEHGVLPRAARADRGRGRRGCGRSRSRSAHLDVLRRVRRGGGAPRLRPPRAGRRRRAGDHRDGRHPVVEASCERGERVRAQRRCSWTTTARRSSSSPGRTWRARSTYLRQVALIVLMAQIG